MGVLQFTAVEDSSNTGLLTVSIPFGAVYSGSLRVRRRPWKREKASNGGNALTDPAPRGEKPIWKLRGKKFQRNTFSHATGSRFPNRCRREQKPYFQRDGSETFDDSQQLAFSASLKSPASLPRRTIASFKGTYQEKDADGRHAALRSCSRDATAFASSSNPGGAAKPLMQVNAPACLHFRAPRLDPWQEQLIHSSNFQLDIARLPTQALLARGRRHACLAQPAASQGHWVRRQITTATFMPSWLCRSSRDLSGISRQQNLVRFWTLHSHSGFSSLAKDGT